MIKSKVAILGAGGFGCEVFHLLDHDLYECIGFIARVDANKKLKAPIIGHENEMEKFIKDFELSECIIAIGDIKKRKKIVDQIKQYPLNFPNVFGPSITNFSYDIDEGTILYPSVVIMNDCKIGQFTLINSGVTLGHDVVIGDFCNINPGANLAGRINIGDGVLIGIGATIKENIKIGNNAVVGAGSVVVKDVKDNETVYGVPAKVVVST